MTQKRIINRMIWLVLATALIIPIKDWAQKADLKTFTLTGKFVNAKQDVDWVYLVHNDGRALIDLAEPAGEDYILKAGGLSKKLSTRSRSYFDRDDVGFEDSARVINGTYKLQGIISGPQKAILIAKNKKGYLPGSGSVFLGEPNLKIVHIDSFGNYKVQGSENNKLYEQLVKATSQPNESPDAVSKVYADYVKQHPTSPVALWALESYAGGEYAVDTKMAASAAELFRLLPAPVQASPLGQRLAMRLEEGKLFVALAPYEKQLEPLNAEYYKTTDVKRKAVLEEEMKAISDQANDKVFLPYVKEHPESPAALYALQQVVKSYDYPEMGYVKINPYFKLLPAEVQQSVDGTKMSGQIALALQTGVGQIALDFTQPDTLGNPVTLSSFRGHYVLVDFWASWCGPCRAESPNLVKAYAKYKSKGFEIISISLDSENARDKWLAAIHSDGMTWINVSDLKGWKNEVARLYGISAIPQNFLIDPDGKIIDKAMRGDDLINKLDTVIK